jgi:hypothetical protein
VQGEHLPVNAEDGTAVLIGDVRVLTEPEKSFADDVAHGDDLRK